MTLDEIKKLREALNQYDEFLRNTIGKPYTVFNLELLRTEIKLFTEQKKLQPELPLDCKQQNT